MNLVAILIERAVVAFALYALKNWRWGEKTVTLHEDKKEESK